MQNPASKLKQQKRKIYQRSYSRNRPIVCNTIRGTRQDVEILTAERRRRALTWIEVLYRGLGIKRPHASPIERVAVPHHSSKRAKLEAELESLKRLKNNT